MLPSQYSTHKTIVFSAVQVNHLADLKTKSRCCVALRLQAGWFYVFNRAGSSPQNLSEYLYNEPSCRGFPGSPPPPPAAPCGVGGGDSG